MNNEDYLKEYSPKFNRETNSGSVSPYGDGLNIVGMTDSQITQLGVFINDFYMQISKKKKVAITRNALTMLRGAIFAIGTHKLNNIEWKEHCSTSIREIFHEWDGQSNLGSDFGLIFRNGKGRLNDEEKSTILNIWNYYKYFSGIDHHSTSKSIFALQSITGNHSLKPDSLTNDVFIEQTKGFMINLSKLFEMSRNI